MKYSVPAVAALVVSVIVLLSSALPVQAGELPSNNPMGALTTISNHASTAATNVLENVADVATTATGKTAIDAVVGDVAISVPTDPAKSISLESSGVSFSVGLPFAESASDAIVVANGVVSFNNNNGSTTTPVVKEDGSLQITTIIADESAPTRYDYQITIPDGGSAVVERDGSLTILNADRTFFAGAASAWAKDTDGISVPTHYELSGSTLTQVVDLSSLNIVFPVVADPWIGIDLINRTWWTNRNKTLSVEPTWWGRNTGVGARWAAWAEVQTKTPGTRENTSSMQDQLFCHFDVVRLRAPNKPTWNLDLGRPNVSYPAMIAKQCNP